MLIGVLTLWGVYKQRIIPGVRVAGFEISNYPVPRAWQSLDILERDYLANNELVFVVATAPSASGSSEVEVSLKPSDFDLRFDTRQTIDKAYATGRNGSLRENITTVLQVWQNGMDLAHEFNIDTDQVKGLVATVAAEIDKPGAKPRVVLVGEGGSKEVKVIQGENGVRLNQEKLLGKILDAIGQLKTVVPITYLEEENNVASENEVEAAKLLAEKLLGKELIIRVETGENQPSEEWKLEDKELVGWVGFGREIDEGYVTEYVETLAETVDREAVNALFSFDEGKVVEFAPSAPGLKLQVGESTEKIIEALENLKADETTETVATLAAQLTEPEIKTGEANDLGIKELLGRGESTFYGSIAGRVHNVALTASKLNGVLVPPGEVFSFNKTVGEISQATGYQSAYVIMGGRTVLGDGGGVCQDSTTLFRAIMDAGLPVVERRAHAYRVGYYEQDQKPGFDATVYSPSPDLKFKNDTPGHILIQAKANTSKLTLVIEFYGTSDGREAAITNYQQWGAVPAPPPLYQDDPTLPPGTIKQVDWAAPGLKVKFDYTVTRGGETIFEETFYSNYRPWQAVYLRGV